VGDVTAYVRDRSIGVDRIGRIGGIRPMGGNSYWAWFPCTKAA